MKSSKNMKYELVASFLFSWCGGEQTNDDDDDDGGGGGDGDEGDEDDEGCRTWWTYGGWLMIDGWWINITTIIRMIFWLYIVANTHLHELMIVVIVNIWFQFYFTCSIATSQTPDVLFFFGWQELQELLVQWAPDWADNLKIQIQDRCGYRILTRAGSRLPGLNW